MQHWFVGSKAPWHEISDRGAALRRLSARVRRRRGTADPRTTEPKPGVVRGACLCGAVAYEADAPLDGRDRVLSLLALPQGARRRARDQRVRRRSSASAGCAAQDRVELVQGAGGGALHAGVLPRLRVGRAARESAEPDGGDSRGLVRRRSRRARGRTHLRGVEGALVRDRSDALPQYSEYRPTLDARVSWKDEVDGIEARRRAALALGGDEAVAAQHAKRPAHGARADRRARRQGLVPRAGTDRGPRREGRARAGSSASRPRTTCSASRSSTGGRAWSAARTSRRPAARRRPPGYANR